MKYALILLMFGVSACSKDLSEDGLKVNLSQPIKPVPDTTVIPIKPQPQVHQLAVSNAVNG